MDIATYRLLQRIDRGVATLLKQLGIVIEEEQAMSAELDALTAQVQKNTDLTKSLIEFNHGLADQIVALKDEPAKLQALADQLKSDDDRIAAAITAGTPASNPPPAPA